MLLRGLDHLVPHAHLVRLVECVVRFPGTVNRLLVVVLDVEFVGVAYWGAVLLRRSGVDPGLLT